MPRKKLTLSVDEKLIQGMKILAVQEGRDLSDLVEDLFRERLKRKPKK